MKPKYLPAWLYLAAIRSALGDDAGAIKAWITVTNIDPNNAGAVINLGNLYLKDGEYQKAADQYQSAIKSRAPDAYFGLGAAYSKMSKTDEAIGAYGKTIAAAPRMAAAYNNLGAELEKKGRTEEAKDQYRKALRIDPKECGRQAQSRSIQE